MSLLGIIARSAALIKFAREQRVTVRDFPNDIYSFKEKLFRFSMLYFKSFYWLPITPKANFNSSEVALKKNLFTNFVF
jgi:hypothetical protein